MNHLLVADWNSPGRQSGLIMRSVFNKHWLRMSLLPALNVLFHLLWNSAPPILQWIAYALQIQSPPLPLPASRHITAGHLGKQLEALPYVYPIIFPCHDHRAGPPRSVQFNFSMEPCWWKLCGLGFRSVAELRCASWLVSHEGGSISEQEGGGDLWWEPCYYGHLRT